MTTTVTFTIVEQRPALMLAPPPAKTEITVTRPSKVQAIAEALAMVAAAHKGEIEQAWNELRAQVEPLLKVAEAAKVPEEQP